MDLRAAYPAAAITVFAGPSNWEAACLLDGPSSVQRIPITNIFAAIRKLRAHNLDVLIDFGPWARLNAILTLLAGAGSTVGFRTHGQHRHFGYDVVVDHRSDVHELENYRSLVRTLGASTSHAPCIRSDALANETGRVRGDFIALHQWAGGRNARLREWPADRWADLARHLADQGYTIVLTGTQSQRALNELVISRVPARTRGLIENAAGLSLAGTAALLAGARLTVSVNTGISHLAAALAVPLVVLHGPTSARRWGPVSASATSIGSPLTGCPYLDLGFEHARHPPKCMEAIEFRTVLDACHRALTAAASGADPAASSAEQALVPG